MINILCTTKKRMALWIFLSPGLVDVYLTVLYVLCPDFDAEPSTTLYTFIDSEYPKNA